MSCNTKQQVAQQAAARVGVSDLASKSSYTAGVTPVAAVPLSPTPSVRPKGKRKQIVRKAKKSDKAVANKKKKSPAVAKAKKPDKVAVNKKKKTSVVTKTKKPDKEAAVFVKQKQAAKKKKKKNELASKKTKQRSFFGTTSKPVRSAHRQIAITDDFTPDELQALSVQFHYGSAAVARAIKESRSKVNLGIGHSDPRPMDWAKQDQKHFRLLLDQLAQVRYRGQKQIDLSSLSDQDLVDLYEFSQFEAERHHRNIDHLAGKLSHLEGPTAEYMSSRHRLQARFHSYLADQLEPFITIKMLDDAEMYSFD